ncbi:MAG: type IV pilus biogenesis/stability protein PilW [Gammaproteobacteria bacterium]|nr:type IV pilus biogenesis/stability protein PilW [Gammaproteobacteria bacterium]
MTNSVLNGLTLAALVVILSACTGAGLAPEKAKDASKFNAELGANYLQRGQLDEAREKLEKALSQDRQNAVAHVYYAQLQHRIGESEQAQSHFQRAINLEPDDATHRNSYGVFLCQIEEYEIAETQFREAADNPYYETPEFALDNAGLCMLDANNLEKAENWLREALRVNPQFANAYLHMADLMHRRERMTVADAYYQRFETYGTATAESLYLGMKINRDSNRRATAESYAQRLLSNFPGSKEAGEYMSRPLQ